MKTRYSLTAIALFLSVCLPHLSEAMPPYLNPTYRGHSLDWCKTFEHGCGQDAADAFCESKGHDKALRFFKKNNVQVRTMCIGDNAVCDPRHHSCDSFKSITCKPKPPKKFINPIYRGYRLDWCKTFERSCGQAAADAFCQSAGYSRSSRFIKDNGVNVQTMCIGNNAVCNPQHHGCDSFKAIWCTN
jgi:hypothetical protein